MADSESTILLQRLEQLNYIGAALSRERSLPHLLELILDAAQALTGADGGTLYRTSSDGQALRFAIVHNRSLHMHQGGTSGQAIDWPEVPLYLASGQPNDSLVAAYAAVHDCTVQVDDAYQDSAGFNFQGTRGFDTRMGYRSQTFLTVPLKNHEGSLIGVLQLINAIEPTTGAICPFNEQHRGLVESLASQAAIALSNHQLIGQLEDLFASFVQLINRAIDEKSPYTAGHCQRVPVLTMMLAEAAHATHEGPLADFHMSAADRHELHMAGLLHDCGKITTPVHVVDKATKLETIYDRIETVETRFELLKRDAQIAQLQAQLALRPCVDAADEAALAEQTAQACAELDTARDFLRHCNLGSEAMAPSHLTQLQAIAERWQWRTPSGALAPCLSADELANLSVRAGTLTAQERDIIKQHIVVTIDMLEQLPWPKHLRNVPEYAGGHHERMDGQGYPRGLRREQMSWQARMLGLADIFEALTAADRPYKQAMPLSQALTIMEKMVANGHIDPDLFDVFVRQGVPLQYGQMFLSPQQLDWPQPENAA